MRSCEPSREREGSSKHLQSSKKVDSGTVSFDRDDSSLSSKKKKGNKGKSTFANMTSTARILDEILSSLQKQ